MDEKNHPQLSVSVLADSDVPSTGKDTALLGFRGILTIQCVVYIVFEVFFPAAIKDSANSAGPEWQGILRIYLAPFIWNPSLIRAGFIILSARTACLPFLQDPSRLTLASTLLRRPIRLLIPLSIALAISTIISNATNSSFITSFKSTTNNTILPTPYRLSTALIYFNAVFNFFWTVRQYSAQAASRAFYNDTLWAISVIFTQSYTVYIAAIIIPYTRAKWRLGGWTIVVLTAWWVQSWAWFTVSGLFVTDLVMHMHLREVLRSGIPLKLNERRGWILRVRGWLLGIILVLSGGTLQYFWKQWRPTFSGRQNDVAQPEARDDDYLLIMGVLVLLESLAWLRRIVGCVVLAAIGRRSLSIYLVASIVLNTTGTSVYLRMMHAGTSSAGSIAVSIVVCLISIAILTEVSYRLVEGPTAWFGRRLFAWLRA